MQEKKKMQEKFDEFIFYIDDLVDEIKTAANVQGFNLDLSLQSLSDLAYYIRKNNIVNDQEHIAEFLNCWVYLGEVFRLHANGAEWTVGVNEPKNINYGLYYLTGYNEIDSEFIPILYVNNFAQSKDRLDNDFFYKLVQSSINPEPPVNLDYLPTEED
ncbi:hypothetical protein [Streptococcus cristatus]|uniref:DUF3806 domain-containing protein n=1 Tax=Streptococcus cristatus TaxID=45634 RepID=A0A139N5A0_STRCR|nr:hypothetical protein [Streptococcus cristatus]KXT71208.1 hypothetical protein SCRDD08_00133 [Streptococcus cristatus]